ncbi:hypothetical protein GKC56_00615 [Neisseriaceae bacterium PsAf]|nr:hypothetical protein [Neisseriaceae bacterium PsAf]MCV2503259.1 hypothetical protein [Neisseriaceae bacterium]
MKNLLKVMTMSAAFFTVSNVQAEGIEGFLENIQKELQKQSGGPQQAQSADNGNWLENLQKELQKQSGGPQQAQSA